MPGRRATATCTARQVASPTSKTSWQPTVPVDTFPLALHADGPVLRFPQLLGNGAAPTARAQMGNHIALYGVEFGTYPQPATVERGRQGNAPVLVGRMEVERRKFLIADDRVTRHDAVPSPGPPEWMNTRPANPWRSTLAGPDSVGRWTGSRWRSISAHRF